jgi:hypothetical protein
MRPLCRHVWRVKAAYMKDGAPQNGQNGGTCQDFDLFEILSSIYFMLIIFILWLFNSLHSHHSYLNFY